MEPNAEVLLYSIVQQVMRTGEILSRAKNLLTASAFADVLNEHTISPDHAARAIEMFETARREMTLTDSQ